jgi:hypothetical protein
LAVAKDENGFKMGENIIIGGLFVQLVAFSVFVIVAAIFHWRIVRMPTSASQSSAVPWQQFLLVLYAVSILILIRCIFRAIEYIQGWDGSLQSVEYWLYIFDSTLMIISVILLNIYHPSRIISARNKAIDSGEELQSVPESRGSQYNMHERSN